MSLINKPYTFSAGAIIYASEHNDNFDTIYTDHNGNITNANIATAAAIIDSKLAQITTAGKVSGAALTSLSSIPSGAGTIPLANGSTNNGSLSVTAGGILYVDGTKVVTLAKDEGKFLQSGASAPAWATVSTTNSSQTVNYTGTDQTGFSTSFADVTGATITKTIVSTSVFVIAHVNFYQNDGAVEGAFTFNIAGSDVAGTAGIASDSAGTVNTSLCVSWLATGLTPGSTTFKLRGKAFTGSGTLRIRVSSGYSVTLTVIEM